MVENAAQIIVTTKDGNEYKAKVIGRDAKTDIALIKIEAPGTICRWRRWATPTTCTSASG